MTQHTPPLDLLIKNGLIIDGSGRPGFVGDVGIRGGEIVAVGAVEGLAVRVLEANGALITPGFVDIHTHYDGQATWDGVLAPSVRLYVPQATSRRAERAAADDPQHGREGAAHERSGTVPRMGTQLLSCLATIRRHLEHGWLSLFLVVWRLC